MIARLLALATGAAGIATLLSYGGRWSWACELLSNFRTHFALLLAPALLLAVAMRSWRIVAAAAAGLALNLWPMHPALSGSAAAPPADTRAVRLVAFNVNVGNDDMRRVARYLESLSPDVVILEELPRENAEQLFALLPSLPHRFHAAGLSAGGVAILSRHRLADTGTVTRGGLALSARADVDLGDRRLRVHGIHFHWPLAPASAAYRNAQLRALGRELAECEGPCVAAGDFNTTPWSSHFRDLLATKGLGDCARGRGFQPTWPAQLPALLRIRIDHCVSNQAVSVAGVRVGEGAGSDHLATIYDLTVAPGAQTKTPP